MSSLFANSISLERVEFDIVSKLKKKAHDLYPMVSKSKIEVSLLNRDMLTQLPEGASSVEFVIPEGSNVVGRTILPLQILNRSNELIETKQLLSEVKVMYTFYKTNRLLKRGELLRASDLAPVELNVANYSDRQLLMLAEIVGKEAKTTIAKNTIVGDWMVREMPLIRQGEMVNLVFQENGLLLKAKGKALEDGLLGSYIRVQSSMKANKIIVGEVINEKSVKVSMLN